VELGLLELKGLLYQGFPTRRETVLAEARNFV
jgi:hypothetical protein